MEKNTHPSKNGGKPKRTLSVAAERRLLSKRLIGDFGGGSWSSIQSLLDRGMIAESGKNLVVTPLGVAYCDAWHLDIPTR
jgi:hypothetical protein